MRPPQGAPPSPRGPEAFPPSALGVTRTCLSAQFAVRALEHRVFQVREMAVCVILDLYRQHHADVLGYLPPDDSTSRKNILFKTIFEGFAKIDGKPTDAEIRVRGRGSPGLVLLRRRSGQ